MRPCRIGLLALLLWAGASCAAQNRMNGPPSQERSTVSAAYGDAVYGGAAYGSGSNPILDHYQRWLSPARGERRCPMHPSCSQYAKNAFAALPWYEALLRTADRLLRCGHDLQWYPAVAVHGERRWFDPVSPSQERSDAPSPDEDFSMDPTRHPRDPAVHGSAVGTDSIR